MTITNNSIKTSEPSEHFLFQVDAISDNSVESLKKFIIENKQALLEKISQKGGIYFKGFPVNSAEDFESIAILLEPELCDKHLFNGDARTWVTKYVYEVASPDIKESLTPRAFHNEDSFTSYLPSTIMFYSLEPAAWGGQTLLADCRKVFTSLPDKIKKKFIDKKVESRLVLHDEVFLVNSRLPKNDEVIAKIAKAHGAKEVKRISENFTEFSFEMPLVSYDLSNNPVWSNLLHLSLGFSWQLYLDTWFAYSHMKGFLNKFKAVYLIAGAFFYDIKHLLRAAIKNQKMDSYFLVNGEKISILERIKINIAFWKNAFVFPLQKGDFVVLNNRTIAHARMPYKGRRVLLSCMGSLILAEKPIS